jgi:hypothetical protein
MNRMGISQLTANQVKTKLGGLRGLPLLLDGM